MTPLQISTWFFNGWDPVWRVLLIGILSYLALIFLLRISGKRTLSKLNAFDFVVTVALGSTLSSSLLNKDLSLGEVAAAYLVLIGMQFLITFFSIRIQILNQLVKSEPALLYYQGKFLDNALRRERINQNEIRAVVRKSGFMGLDKVQAVVLETDGSLSVVRHLDPDVKPGNQLKGSPLKDSPV